MGIIQKIKSEWHIIEETCKYVWWRERTIAVAKKTSLGYPVIVYLKFENTEIFKEQGREAATEAFVAWISEYEETMTTGLHQKILNAMTGIGSKYQGYSSNLIEPDETEFELG